MQQTGAGWVSGWILRGMKCGSNFLLELSSGNMLTSPNTFVRQAVAVNFLSDFFGGKFFWQKIRAGEFLKKMIILWQIPCF